MGGSVGRVARRGSGGSAESAQARDALAALVAGPRAPLTRLEPLLTAVRGEALGTVDAGGYNLLQRAVALGRADLLRVLVSRGARAPDLNRGACSLPLHIACLLGHEECVEVLLKHGARVDSEARMCYPGPHHSNCELYSVAPHPLAPRPAHPPKIQSAIYYAIDGDQVNVLNMLAQKMEEPWIPFRTRKPLLHIACERAAWKCVQHLVNVRSEELHMIKDEYYPIHLAVLHDIKFLELLTNNGADTCAKTYTQQMTLLHMVLLIARKSAEETLSIVKFLLEHGCKNVINTPDGLGNTPLHMLVVRYALEEARYGTDRWNKWGVLNLARYLLQAGAGLSINQPGNSALTSTLRHIRDWDVCYELLNMMLAHGGEPNMIGRDGSVPIMVCLVPLINKDPLHHFTHSMKVCYLNCIRILLKYGANPNCSYRSNLTPLHVLIFTISENITLNCGTQKRSNFDFIKNLLVLLLQHGLDCNLRATSREQHILQSCTDMVQNVRSVEDILCIHQLILTLMQYGADADTHLSDRSLTSIFHGEDLQCHVYPVHEAIENRTSFRNGSKNTLLYYYIMLITKKEHILTDPNMNFAKIIYLFYFSMEHKPLYMCLKSLYTQYIAQVPAKSTENLVLLIKDLYKMPRTLKQIARCKIYRYINRKPALIVNKLNLPSSLKEYILNFEP